jgi:dynein heavy chain
MGSEINAALNPILLKQTYKKGMTTYLKMGENALIYSNDFYLYMTTKLRNPHFLPEVCTQTVIINFMITDEGLVDQLLALLVSK